MVVNAEAITTETAEAPMLVAMTRGREPVLTWEASSRNVTSRTQWILFSMPRWPLT